MGEWAREWARQVGGWLTEFRDFVFPCCVKLCQNVLTDGSRAVGEPQE